ncbi:hypothetical protein AMELA_G00174120 [Ameiurus melas]|uniref:Uncharacterized protein n=1 Tax=Ameiurus melas TaxID=219545 RepID=A0A7J6ACT3_AMEME|nr:hypothetical protein AMELA_G00174120 [Ameiurus melas]
MCLLLPVNFHYLSDLQSAPHSPFQDHKGGSFAVSTHIQSLWSEEQDIFFSLCGKLQPSSVYTGSYLHTLFCYLHRPGPFLFVFVCVHVFLHCCPIRVSIQCGDR